MLKNYYFLAPTLPSLTLGEEPEISFSGLMTLLETNLSSGDLKRVQKLCLAVDLQNVRSLVLGQPIDPHGNLGEKELDEALLLRADLPDYVFEFLGEFSSDEEGVRNFFGLMTRYFEKEIEGEKGFLKKLLTFQRGMRLVLAAMRAKRLKRDVTEEFQFEEFTDPLVAHILAQKDMDEYDPPPEFSDLVAKVNEAGSEPMAQHRAVLQHEFDVIEEMSEYPLFSLDWILGYVARLMLVERMWNLDQERGDEIVDRYKTG